MNISRVTVGSNVSRSIDGIESASARVAALQDQASSGKRINSPSDDPSGAVQAMQLRGALSRNTQYASNAADATSWLSNADSTLSQVNDVLQSARTAVVQASNTGTADASSNTALSQQLASLRSALLSLANSSYQGQPIFGGTTTSSTAYDDSGAFVGDTGTITRAVGANETVSVNASGPAVFGDESSGDNVFTVLQNLSSALTTTPSTLPADALQQLDTALSRVSTAQSTAGSTLQQVQRAQTAQTANGTAITTNLSSVENVDYADLAIKLSSANFSYQAALQTTAKIGQLSLLDFLR